jgi:hypothetical protein
LFNVEKVDENCPQALEAIDPRVAIIGMAYLN